MVLADTILKRSLIADYDPLAFWEPWKNYGPDNIGESSQSICA